MKTLSQKGFTRTDLITVVAIVTTIVGISVPSLARITGRSVISQCAGNLQRYALALEIYGNENQDMLPAESFGSWVWDTSTFIETILTNNGASPATLYCPGTSVRFTEQDNLGLFNYQPGVYGVLGYAGTFPGTAGLHTSEGYPFGTNANVSFTTLRVRYFALDYPITAATRSLVADATLCNDPGNLPAPGAALQAAEQTYNWATIQGGTAKPQMSAHLNGSIPLGGNVGMLDGHVEWRPFANMIPRGGGNGNPVFFW